MEDELDDMIRDAFNSALGEIGKANSVRVADVIPHQDSERYTVSLRQESAPYLSSQIDSTEVLSDIKGGRLTVEAFKKFAHRELQKHFPDAY